MEALLLRVSEYIVLPATVLDPLEMMQLKARSPAALMLKKSARPTAASSHPHTKLELCVNLRAWPWSGLGY